MSVLLVSNVAPAFASQVSSAGGTIGYTADAGEANDVTVSYSQGSGNYTITDAGVLVIGNGFGCTLSGNQATCPGSGVTSLSITLGDMDDRATIDQTINQSVPVVPVVSGEDGNDTIIDNSASYTPDTGISSLDGGTGNDSITYSANGPDAPRGTAVSLLRGEEGNDTLTATGSAPVSAQGGPGDDTVQGGGGSDALWGGDDGWNDQNSGNNTVDGGDGDDLVQDGGGDSTLRGGAGNDVIDTGDGDDHVLGGDGDDEIDVQPLAAGGADTIDAGAGDDVIWGYETPDAIDTLTCGAGSDKAGEGPNDVVAVDCEVVYFVFTCPSSPEICTGTATVTGTTGSAGAKQGVAAASRQTVTLASRRFQVKPGNKRKLKLRLDKSKERLVLKGRDTAPVARRAKWRKGDRRFYSKQPFKLSRVHRAG